MRGEGRIVAAAVLGVQHQSKVEQLRLKRCIFAGDAQHPQSIFCRGKPFFRSVNYQTLSAVKMLIGLIAVYRQHRECRYQMQTLPQYIFGGNIVRVIVIGVECQYTAGKNVHHIPPRCFHNHISHKGFRQAAKFGKHFFKPLQFLFVRQRGKQQQIGGFLKAEAVF